MSGLFSLPNELLYDIFARLPDLQTAARFASISKLLQSHWTENGNHVVLSILHRTVLAYEDAITLAIAETTGKVDRPEHLNSTISTWAPVLIINLTMCRRVLELYYPDYMKERGSDPDYPWDMERSSRYYYVSRLIVLAYDVPKLRAPALLPLREQPTLILWLHFEFHRWFTYEQYDDELNPWHGIDGEIGGTLYEVTPKWDYAAHKIEEFAYYAHHQESGKPFGPPSPSHNSSWLNYRNVGFEY